MDLSSVRCETLRFFLFKDDLQSRRSPVIQREPSLIQRLQKVTGSSIYLSAQCELHFLFTGGRHQLQTVCADEEVESRWVWKSNSHSHEKSSSLTETPSSLASFTQFWSNTLLLRTRLAPEALECTYTIIYMPLNPSGANSKSWCLLSSSGLSLRITGEFEKRIDFGLAVHTEAVIYSEFACCINRSSHKLEIW